MLILPALMIGLAWLLVIGPRLPLQEARTAIDVNFLISTAALVIAALVIVFGAGVAAASTPRSPHDGKGRLVSFQTLAIIFGSTFLAAFTLTFASEPPLTAVDLEGTSNIEGTLLTHADGVWYVFDQQGTLTAIPDNEVKIAKLSPSGE